MSRLKLLTCITQRAAFYIQHQNHCVSTWLVANASSKNVLFCNHSDNINNFSSKRYPSYCAIQTAFQPFHGLKTCNYDNTNRLRYPTIWSTTSFKHNTKQTFSTKQTFTTKSTPDNAGKPNSKSSTAATEADIFGDTSKLGLFAKFKLMYKKYWYVLIPVHVATSIGWLGAFYYLSKSGVDVPQLLQHLHLSENIIQKVQNSDMGHIAIAYLCYKVATPIRYAVTLGGTTVSIKYLVQMGYIKPIPTKDEFIQMYEQKKAVRAAAKAEKENMTTGTKGK